MLPSLRTLIEDEGYSVFHHAPALVLVLAKSAQPQACEDCCPAAENLMLAARGEGLRTCCIGLARPWFNLRSTKHELGLPEQYEVVVPIVLGHPKKRGLNHMGGIPPRFIGSDNAGRILEAGSGLEVASGYPGASLDLLVHIL